MLCLFVFTHIETLVQIQDYRLHLNNEIICNLNMRSRIIYRNYDSFLSNKMRDKISKYLIRRICVSTNFFLLELSDLKLLEADDNLNHS